MKFAILESDNEPSESLPSRERGLKFEITDFTTWLSHVAPLAGAWIEIPEGVLVPVFSGVAPLAGAWIEM